jgi:tRNA(Ile)-lysidine synthase
MPRLQWRDGVCLARPWLDQPRQAVRALVESQGLAAVEDPSNQETRYARNRVRKAVWPALAEAFEQVEASLALAALRCAQSLDTLAMGARRDLQQCGQVLPGPTPRLRLDQPAWAALTPARRSWVLRAWFEQAQIALPAAVVEQVAAFDGSTSTTVRWSVDAARELRWYRGVLSLATVSADAGRAISSEAELGTLGGTVVLRLSRSGIRRVKAWGGTLVLRRAATEEHGLKLSLPLVLHIRPRLAGDQFQLTPRGTARSLKKQFQARGVPAWERGGPVVATEDGSVLLVPGLGMDARMTLPGGSWVLLWQPDSTAGQE